MAENNDNANSDNDDNNDEAGTGEKIAASAIILILTPPVEIVTGFAPIGTAGAVTLLAGIWGLPLLDGADPEAANTGSTAE